MPAPNGAVRPALRWACGALASVIAFLVVFVPAELDASVDAVVGATLAEARGEAAVLRVSVPGTEPVPAVPATLTEVVGGEAAAVLHRSVLSAPLRVAGIRSVLLSADTLEGAVLSGGQWPETPAQTALSRELAESAAAGVGDAVTVAGQQLTVTGIWAPAGGEDAPWLRSPPTSAGDDDPVGAAVVTPIALADLAGTDVRQVYTVQPAAGAADLAVLRSLAVAWRGARGDLQEAGVTDAEFGGALVPSAQLALGRGDALAATAPLSLGIALLVAIGVAAAFVPALLAARADRRALMWARGASTGRLARDAAGEVVLAAAAGAAIGAGIGAVLTAPGRDPVVVVGSALLTAVATTAALAGTAAALAAIEGRGLARTAERRRGGRTVALAVLGVWTALAVLSSWQLMLYGSVGAADRGVDAATAAAPALALIALVGLGAAVLWAARAPIERAGRRARGAGALVVTRGLFSRGILSVVPVVLVALAAGHLVFAAGFDATWDRQAQADAQARWGAPLSVAAPAGLSAATERAVLETAGLAATAPAWSRDLSIAAEPVTALAVAAPAVAALAGRSGDVTWEQLLTPAQPLGAAAPDGPVTVTVTGSAAARVTDVRAVFQDDFGCLHTVNESPTGGVAPLHVPPVCAGGARVVAVDLVLAAADAGGIVTLALVTAAGDADLRSWEASDPEAAGSPAGGPESAAIGPEAGRLRFTAPVPSAALPVAVSRGLAAATGLAPGDRARISLPLTAAETEVEVSEVVDAVPGAGADAALLADSRPLAVAALAEGAEVPRAAALWVRPGEAPAAVVAALRSALPLSVTVEGPAAGGARDLLAGAPRTVWVGAIGSAVLAVLGIAGVLVARRARLAAERAALRTAGATSRDVAGAGRQEFAVLGAAGAVVGIVAGLLVVAVLCPPLARGAGGGLTGAVGAALAPTPTLVSIAGLAVVLAAAVIGAGLRDGGGAR